MNISHLNEFIVLARCLSFTSAAQRIGISQPALSKHLMSLESDLGVSLIDRDKRQLKLTPAGAFVLERASAITMEYESMKQQARLIEKQRPRQLIIEALDSYHLFREVLRVTEDDLLRSTPQLAIAEKEFDLTSERLVLDHLAEGVTDLAIIPEAFTHIDSRFDHVHLYQERLGALIPVDSPLAQKDKLFAHDLDGIPVWLPCSPDSTSFMQSIEKLFLDQGSTPIFKSKFVYDYTRSDAFSFPNGVYVNCFELFMSNLPSLLRNDFKFLPFENDNMFLWIDAVWKKDAKIELIELFMEAYRKRLRQLGNSMRVWDANAEI